MSIILPCNRFSGVRDTPETPAPIEPLRCGSCGKEVDVLEKCHWDETIMVGRCCRYHEDECECTFSGDVQYTDNCPVHSGGPKDFGNS